MYGQAGMLREAGLLYGKAGMLREAGLLFFRLRRFGVAEVGCYASDFSWLYNFNVDLAIDPSHDTVF